MSLSPFRLQLVFLCTLSSVLHLGIGQQLKMKVQLSSRGDGHVDATLLITNATRRVLRNSSILLDVDTVVDNSGKLIGARGFVRETDWNNTVEFICDDIPKNEVIESLKLSNEKQIASKDEEIQKLRLSKDAEIQRLLSSKDEDIRRLQSSHDRDIASKHEEIRKLRLSKDREISSKNAEVQRLLSSKDKDIKRLRSSHDRDIASKDEEIRRLRLSKDREISSKDAEVQRLRSSKAEEIKILLSSKEEEIKRLQLSNNLQLRSKNEEIKKLQSSCSRKAERPEGYEYSGYGYLKYHTAKADFRTASKACENEGGHLAIINSEEEAAFLLNIIKRNGHYGGWVGVHDPSRTRDFRTVFGTRLSETGYSKWRIGQPNGTGAQFCVYFHRDGGLGDFNCDFQNEFVCERAS